ncbi:MAG: N-acetylneuraminate synthase family protein [Methanobrevibacter sp.]|uniref:N-acetylneuraminate synthase family protein n=1 Tax=Methanobrevibacter sp. TaxID=66852 RepID=UPI0025F53B28|nr:N-acetylneuraminate synthase family protein [Methanobrevibacter sp.]MBR0271775.1 N-acetylneuraminate synthase family protein [Methanobrevibacter sp.]
MKIFHKNPYLIADIGVNYYDIAEKEELSLMDAAKLMILEAKKCGIDAVKFQSYKTENIVSKKVQNLDDEYLASLFDLFKKYDEFGHDEFRQLADYCNEIGIKFLSTPLDTESADYLDEFMDIYPLSSSDLTNIPFIQYIAGKNKPILLSTGGATLNEVKHAVRAIEDVSTVDIAIMHSILSFPTNYQDANLAMIKDLAQNFPDYEIGYSDHTISDSNMFVLTTAYNYGAVVIEKHFTLDKSLPGDDHIHSMDPEDVMTFKTNIGFLSQIRGMKNKQPLIYESSTRRAERRSIVLTKSIKKGDVISRDILAFKRPGIGISPDKLDEVVGKTALVDIEEDTLIDFDMFE